jgi:hypothetical protein
VFSFSVSDIRQIDLLSFDFDWSNPQSVMEAAFAPSLQSSSPLPTSCDPLQTLPRELASRIFLSLDVDSLRQCVLVARNWHTLISADGHLWRTLVFRDFLAVPVVDCNRQGPEFETFDSVLATATKEKGCAIDIVTLEAASWSHRFHQPHVLFAGCGDDWRCCYRLLHGLRDALMQALPSVLPPRIFSLTKGERENPSLLYVACNFHSHL